MRAGVRRGGRGWNVADGFVRIFSEDHGGAAAIEPVDVIEAMDLAKRARRLAVRDVVLARVGTLGACRRGRHGRGGHVRRGCVARHDEDEDDDTPHATSAYHRVIMSVSVAKLGETKYRVTVDEGSERYFPEYARVIGKRVGA